MKRIEIEVVAAVIKRGEEIFATQRRYGESKDWREFKSEALHLNEHEASAWLPADEQLLSDLEKGLA